MKVFELLIDEEDDISGVEKISIVKQPATQLSWEIFNDKIHNHTCFYEEDINPDLLDILDKYGEEIPVGLLDDVEVYDIEEYQHKFYSVGSQPNKRDFLNDLSLDSITRYVYTIDNGAGSVLKPESRQFCRRMIGAGRVYSRQDLQKISLEIAGDSNTFKIIPRPGSIPSVDVFNFKGGKNCYHRYKALVFNLKVGETYDQLLQRIPYQAQRGVQQADLVYEGADRPFLSEALHYNMSHQSEFKANNFFMGLFFYPSVKSAFINQPEVRNFTKVEFCGYEGWCPLYIGEEYFEGQGKVIDRFEVKEMFEVPTKEIQEIGKKVVDWTEENGWGDCGTQVGKTRASQLAAGENLSLETITRMYSYLSRHKVDLESSTSYEDGCGKLMYDSWGGEPALEWSKRIVEKGTNKEQLFSVDNYKGEITAVVFEPDTYIYRFSEGKSYYVFMSKETIKKALMKVSRLKEMGKLQNFINLEHSDYTFNAEDVYTYENWLVGDNSKEDKSYQIFGKEMKPGTWITTIAFKDKKIFEEYVLSNETTGISLEGFFTEIPFNFGDVSPETFIEVRPGESESDYVSRCAGSSVLIGEFPDEKQRLAVCYSYWRDKFAEVGERGAIKESAKAPKSDTPNKDPEGEGTAKGDASNTRSAEVSKEVEEILQKKSDDFNERYKDKLGYGVNVGMLKSVYQRGVGAYNTSHSPEVKSSQAWALARVNAFLYIVKNGRAENKKYVGDNDLLPKGHPKSENMEITTDGMSPYLTPNEDELETKEVFDFIGDIGGAPAYTTESGADSKSKEMGCEGTHYMEGQGYFPCKTHKEATDLYQSQKIYEMVVEVMKHYKQ